MDNPVFRSAHKAFRIKYHLALIIKYRKDPFLNDKYVQTFKNVCRGLEERYSVKFETVGFDEDYVHFLLQSLPRYSPSQLFRVVKSITAIQLFKVHPDIKEELWGGEFWSDGGYVGTVGEGVNADIIRNYIRQQVRHGDQLQLVDFL